MPNKLAWIAVAVLMQVRTVVPPLPGTPSPANAPAPAPTAAGNQPIFTTPGIFGLPPGVDQSGQLLPPGTATIDGIVTALGTSDPIPGASVEIRNADCGKTSGAT